MTLPSVCDRSLSSTSGPIAPCHGQTDPGYEGAGQGIYTPVKQPGDGRELDVDTRTYNALLRSLRCLGERGFALLVQRWRTLQHVSLSPSRIGNIAKAALVLVHFEHNMII